MAAVSFLASKSFVPIKITQLNEVNAYLLNPLVNHDNVPKIQSILAQSTLLSTFLILHFKHFKTSQWTAENLFCYMANY